MNQEPLPQIHLIRDTDLSVFAYELHIFAGDFLRECEFNMRSLATNTGADSIAIMGKNHIWLSDALFAYCSTADLYQMISTTEFIGARAFLFHTDRREGLYADDLEAMNEREAEKFVKKDNVWKKPDYAAMLEEGIPLGVVYFIKKARDGLNASPQYYRTDDTPEKRTARQKEYIKTVRELQTVLSDVRTVEDAMRAYDRFFVDNGYLEKVQGWVSGIHYRATKKGQDNPVITNKLSNTMLIRSAEYFERNFTQKAKKEQFCVSKEQKIPKGYAIHFNDGKHTYSKNEDWKPGTYYVTKGYSILRTNFETKEAALKWVQELAKGRNKNGKIRFVPPQLAHVKRTGPDYRNGVEITGQHYLDTFGFRGGEFGNWMNQNDRQTSLNMGFEALKDLASALKISDKDIAYQGTLAIAFGARGSGNAAAHYEPLRTVINLTKMHGAGSLAHEWWHGLDDYLGTKMGAKGMLSEQPRLYAPFQKLIDTMKYKPETGGVV